LKAFVLGIDHTIQETDDEGRLKAIIRTLCDAYGFDLIAEEWSTSHRREIWTVGRKVAAERSIGWLNIDIAERVRERLGILHDLNRRNKPSFFNEQGPVYEIPNYVYLPRADCLREHRWLRKIVRFKPHTSVLVTCGFIHVRPFASKLRSASFDVVTANLCEYEWYRSKGANRCADAERGIIDERY
jgi:hypothetical protein